MKQAEDNLKSILSDIERYPVEAAKPSKIEQTFELWSDPNLLKDLSGNIGAFLIRSILHQLNIDEHHVLRWRLENKYRQYQIINHYFPQAIAQTFSFAQLLNQHNGVQTIRELCEDGFFVKSTLGHRSGIKKNFDRTSELDEILQFYPRGSGELETWMIQKRINFQFEFRVHTFGRDLLHGLTFIMEGDNSLLSIHAEDFVKAVSAKLPDAILQDTLIGWDIGLTGMGECYVIETNITGYHPDFHRGFQSSGYFGDPDYGPIMCAVLNAYFKNTYNLSIEGIDEKLSSSNEFYKEFIFYCSIWNKSHTDMIKTKLTSPFVAAIVYMGSEVNSLTIKLLRYLQIIDYATVCYVVINKEQIQEVNSMMFAGHHVQFIQEDLLFKSENYLLIEQLPYAERKDRCCQKALQKIGSVCAVIF